MEYPQHYITTFYHFFKILNVPEVQKELEKQASDLHLLGLVVMGPEGLNCTVSSVEARNLEKFKSFIRILTGQSQLNFKDSESGLAPFRRFVVKVREEIVTLGTPELVPTDGKNQHLSPGEWNRVMKEERDYVLIDTRNWYETKIGTFKGAVNPRTDKFTDFPQFMESQNISKEKKVLIFCTGGIRCEKGILELQRQGYDQVYQLEGGILNYLKEYPNDQFEGECFVFDHRVAIDQNLQPTKNYGLCPHCGQPGSNDVTCVRCDTEVALCEACALDVRIQNVCSKNCAYQWELKPGRKAEPQAHQMARKS